MNRSVITVKKVYRTTGLPKQVGLYRSTAPLLLEGLGKCVDGMVLCNINMDFRMTKYRKTKWYGEAKLLWRPLADGEQSEPMHAEFCEHLGIEMDEDERSGI